MKVILLRDVARIGKKGEVKNVPDGHAQNFLLPRKFAEMATAENIIRIERERTHKMAHREAAEARFSEFLKTHSEQPIELRAPANEGGHLFKGLRAEDVARALAHASGSPIRPEDVTLERPIKELGTHTISVAYGGVRGEAIINVIKQ